MDLEVIDKIIARCKQEGGSVIGVLQDVQQLCRYLPRPALERISAELQIPMSRLYGLATFYKSFRLDEPGKHHVCVCVGTACHVSGAEKLVDALQRTLKVEPGQTTADRRFTLETVSCVGACALGPLVMVNGQYHSKMTAAKTTKLLDQCD